MQSAANPEGPTAVAASPLSARLSCDRAINYAFQQNAIPLVRELVLVNDSAAERRDLVVRLFTEPAFAFPAEFRVQSLPPGGEFRLAPVDLRLSPEFLDRLNEKLSGLLHLEVTTTAAGTAPDTPPLLRQSEPVSLLARNEWCGLVSLPEILAAFVLPNDPAVARILGDAAEILRAQTGRSELNAYQDKNRQRAWQQVAAIYQAIARLGLRYISPPASFESTGQKIRPPSEVLEQRLATCLDLALLFAACCEQAGLHPLVLLHEGHALGGCWLVETTLADATTDDHQLIRKRVELEELTVFELTALTGDTPGTLDRAESLAGPHLAPDAAFRLALDVKRARAARILPLPLPGQPAPTPDSSAAPATAADPGALGERTFSVDTAAGAGTGTSSADAARSSRIDLWKSRLLDLSLRNRLLNFRPTVATVEILSPSPERVEDELAAHAELRLLPRPQVMSEADPRDAQAYARRQSADALAEHLRAELQHGRLHTALGETEHARRLTELYRAARVASEENGTNTLFAAVGFLEWREAEHSDRVLRAPLLLVPVELKRKSVLEGFQLRRLDEETRLNVTLVEMLRQHFKKEIPGVDPLPEDQNGVDVARVFRLFREAVRDLPGWEVKSELWLGLFSFTKFLLWQDLSDRLDALTRNRVVRHLVQEGGGPFPNPPDDIQPHEIDERFTPAEIFCPRSADSSQLAAVFAAAAGHDFVLEGPPGTGKSQTITNIVAHCLAEGKRVLFVAEKRAALDVVHRRLREEGLAPFCLELHSNKSGKADVLAQFRESLTFAARQSPDAWTQHAAELQRVRDELNAYVRALHRRQPCGLSAFDCLDHLLPRSGSVGVRLPDLPVLTCDAALLERGRDAARQLSHRAELIGDVRAHPLAPLHATDWSPAWAERARAQRENVRARVAPAERTAADFRTWLARSGAASLRELRLLRELAGLLLAPHAVGPAFLTTPWDALVRDLDAWIALVRERQSLRATLAGYDEAKLTALDLDALSHRWQAAQASWFVLKWLRIGGLRRALRSARTDAAKPAADTIAATLAQATRLREINRTLAAAASAAVACLGPLWHHGEPDADQLAAARPWGEALHAQLLALAGDDLPALRALRERLAALFAEGPACFAPTTALGRRFADFAREWDALAEALAEFAATVVLDRTEIDAAPDHLASVAQLLDRVDAAWPRIRPWCSWQKARAEAGALGLGPLCTLLESAGGPPAAEAAAIFEVGFRRALFDAILEGDDVLRSFFGHEHAGLILRFRELDERHTRLTRDLIRARLAARLPSDTGTEPLPKDELTLLRKEIGKKTRHLPVRQLLGRIPSLLPRLKPCVLMSPLSVAQYLDASHEHFDVVIFDEASQIPVWDAVGAIARGRQLIVVGDPKQLPPTNFFQRSEEDAADPEALGEFQDLESILDELLSNGLRHKRLQWHYRSRREGLIAFSNRQYYENDLLTFPSPDVHDSGVRLQLVEGVYDKGRTRTNRAEAEALVGELVRRLRDPVHGRRSYGVVTFSLAQQSLIENLLDEQRRLQPDIETHFGDAPPVEGEPVFVKNLENVQGDERDVILFSVCYGPDAAGRTPSMNFGPLNRDGGERRLNVAITRAKHAVLVFSTLRGEQFDLTRTRARGVHDLKFFLDYAERGPRALAATAVAAGGDSTARSEFAQMVADRLRQLGHEVHADVGCSGYRVDLAVVDPADPGCYLLGIECDGPTYHRAATARDRDKLRQLVLEGLGWRLHRVWSTDWWHDPEDGLARLSDAIVNARRSP